MLRTFVHQIQLSLILLSISYIELVLQIPQEAPLRGTHLRSAATQRVNFLEVSFSGDIPLII